MEAQRLAARVAGRSAELVSLYLPKVIIELRLIELADGLQHRPARFFDVDDLLREGVALNAPLAGARAAPGQLIVNR